MKNKHLSMEERNIIERLMQAGKSNKAIGGGAWAVGKYDWARAGAELLAGRLLGYQGEKAQGFSDGRRKLNENRGFQGRFGRKSSKYTTKIGARNRSLEC